MAEIWKPVPFHSNYEVSNLGNVRSLNFGFQKRMGTLRPTYVPHGYLRVIVRVNGKKRGFYVHRLVMLAFVGEPGKDQSDVNHIDGDKRNNAVTNLEYCSRAYNMRHAGKTGLMRRKLSDKDVQEIRRSKQSRKQLAARFKVCANTIARIINFKTRQGAGP